jgi:hypothetical protein
MTPREETKLIGQLADGAAPQLVDLFRCVGHGAASVGVHPSSLPLNPGALLLGKQLCVPP